MKHLQLELSSLIDLFHEKFLFFLCFLSLIFYQCTIDGKRLYFIGSEVDSPPPPPPAPDFPPSVAGTGLRVMESDHEPADIPPFSRHPHFARNDGSPEAGPMGCPVSNRT